MTDEPPRVQLPDDVLALIDAAIPDTDALEILMFMVRRPADAWVAAQIVEAIQFTRGSVAQVEAYLALLHRAGLTAAQAGTHAIQPASPALVKALGGLVDAYQQRPVTLIRTIYAIADARKLRAFAEAFRIAKEPKDR